MIQQQIVPKEDVREPRDVIRTRAMAFALLEPYGLAPTDPQNSFRGKTIATIAERCSLDAGLPRPATGHAPLDVRALYTSSDFPSVIDTVAQTAFLSGWESGPQSWNRFCLPVSVRSFRPEQTVIFGGLSNLEKLYEGQEVNAADLDKYMYKDQAERYGAGFGISEVALTNNDLGILIQDARTVGQAAAATLANAVFSCLASNPTMLDGGSLFNLTGTDTAGGHANKSLADSAISGTAISLGKAAMRKQKGAAGGRPLNIRPRYLIAPAELEEAAWEAVGLAQGFGEQGSDLERYLLDAGRVEVITTPFLMDSAAWYLSADPTIAPLIRVAFLHGAGAPRLVSQSNFASGGMDFVAWFNFGVAPGDWRGGYLNAGA